MIKSSKLSDRFKNSEKKKIQLPQMKVEEEVSVEIITSDSVDSLEAEFKKALMQKIESIPVWFDYSEDKQRELVSSFVTNKLSSDAKTISDNEKELLINRLQSAVTGFGPLDYLISQENVSNIFVNGLNTVFIEIAGRVLNTEIKLNENQLNFILKNIYNQSEIKPDENSKIWNCKVRNLVISVILPPISANGANISIKKVSSSDLDMSTLINENFLSKDIFEYILSLVNSKKNIIISGDINSGKSRLLDTVIKCAMQDRRGVLIEEFPQMISNSDSMMKFSFDALKTRYDFDILVSSILKMSPDFVVVDSNNPYYFNSCAVNFSDLNGLIMTLRAGNTDAATAKFVSTYAYEEKLTEKQAKAMFLKAFDYIVQVNKTEDGVRRVTSVFEIAPTKTSALSLKEVVKWENNQYISEIPQPLTSLKADPALIVKSGSMKARFYKKDLV